MNKGTSLNWPTWVGLLAGFAGTVITNYVVILNRVTAVELRADYVAKDFEKSEQRAQVARAEMLTALSSLRNEVIRNGAYQAAYAAPAPYPPIVGQGAPAPASAPQYDAAPAAEPPAAPAAPQ